MRESGSQVLWALGFAGLDIFGASSTLGPEPNPLVVARRLRVTPTWHVRIADHAQRSVPDQTGAEQRGDLEIAIAVGNRETEALVGDGELRISAVDVIASEACSVAQVLTTALAVAA